MNKESKPDEPKPTADSEPTLRVDEDWKEQVAKEKAAEAGDSPPDDGGTAAEQRAAADGGTAGVTPADETPDAGESSDVATDADAAHDAASSDSSSPQMPPASFEFLVSMLFTQAISFLGQVPNPESGETRVDKPMAKHSIDTLDLLTEKTRGNLTDDESRMLADALHALRMTYVNARNTTD